MMNMINQKRMSQRTRFHVVCLSSKHNLAVFYSQCHGQMTTFSGLSVHQFLTGAKSGASEVDLNLVIRN